MEIKSLLKLKAEGQGWFAENGHVPGSHGGSRKEKFNITRSERAKELLDSNSEPMRGLGSGSNSDEYMADMGLPDDFYFYDGDKGSSSQGVQGNWKFNTDYSTKDYESSVKNVKNSTGDNTRLSYFRKQERSEWKNIVKNARKKVINGK